MRTAIIILLIITVAILILLTVFKRIKEKISFDFGKIKKIDLDGFRLSQLLAQGQTWATVTTKLDVKNDNNFDISFSNLYTEIYFNNQIVAKTKKINSVPTITKANSSTEIVQDMYFSVSQNSLACIVAIQQQHGAVIDYIVKLSLYGNRITFKNKYTA